MPTISVPSDPVYAPTFAEGVNYLGQVTITGQQGTAPVTDYTMSRTWVRTPGFMSGFKNKVTRRNDLPMNNFSFTKRTSSYPTGAIEFLTVGGTLPNGDVGINRSTWSGALFESNLTSYSGNSWPNIAPATMPQIDTSKLDAEVRTGFLLTVKDQKANLVQAFAERGQTARLLASTVKRVSKSIDSLKRGNLHGAADALGIKVSAGKQKRFNREWRVDQQKAIADWWLELQYGWKPLLMDVHGSAELLAQHDLREVRNRVVKSMRRVATVEGVSTPSYDPSKGKTYYIHRRVTREVTIKYVAYYSTSSVNKTLAQVGVTNPALIAWELLPWSFIYDWFIPIGNYISSLDATNGLSFEKGCKTVFEKIKVRGWTKSGRLPSFTGHGVGTLLAVSYSGSGLNEEIVNVERTKLTAWPDSSLPSFKNPVSFTHAANALALLRKSVRLR